MLAAQISRFGGPEVLELNEVDRPTPDAGEVVVAIEAASVNGHDTILRSGGMTLVSGRRFPIGLGLDFVGSISEGGANSSRFRRGERVWGTVHPQKRHVVGSAAEYVVVAEDRLGAAPSGLPAPDAAALVVAGATALIALRDALAVSSGQRLLIRGAAGGVGSAAVQIAHARGVHVTALAGARSHDGLSALGADIVLDRATTDPRQVGPFDAVLDLVGSHLPRWRGRLNRSGRMVTVAISGPALFAIALSSVHGPRRIRTFSANPHTDVLDEVAKLVDTGALRPVVASVRPLTEIAEAHRAFERGGVLGKHVLLVGGATSPR